MKTTTIGRQAFIDEVLRLLDEGVPIRDLNLRRVAKELGCAHTNAYNWFKSQQELLWFALGSALEHLIALMPEDRMPLLSEPGNLIERYVQFVEQHPAWFRLIWMEELAAEMPSELEPILARPSHIMARWLRLSAPSHMSDEQVLVVGSLLFSSMHGRLCLAVTGRMDDGEQQTLAQDTVAMGRMLLYGSSFS